MTKHYYRYFISYYFNWRPKQNLTNKPYQSDFASVSLDCDTMIENDEDIRLLMEIIKNDLNKSMEVRGHQEIIDYSEEIDVDYYNSDELYDMVEDNIGSNGAKELVNVGIDEPDITDDM